MSEPGFEDSHRVIKPAPANAEVRPEALWQRLTPNHRFFIRSNFPFPDPPEEGHRLRVEGAVEHALDLSLEAIEAFPQRTRVVTLECAGNGRTDLHPTPEGEPWRVGAVSTAEWTGVPLADLLLEAGLKPEAVEVLAHGGDQGTIPGKGDTGYARSLPIDKALDPDTLLVLRMNGEELPLEHGAPLRLVVPGWYGMASVKWLRRIEAITEPWTGHFQHDRYRYEYEDGTSEPVTRMRVRSLITDPVNNSRVASGPIRVRGWAWSGAGVVTRVEVSLRGGDAWEEADLGAPTGPHGWRAWSFDWEPDGPGLHLLRSRATDASGAVQPHQTRWNRHGYGNNAIRPTFVNVIDPG